MIRCSVRDHVTHNTSVTYWRTEEDAKAWLKSYWPGTRASEWGIYSLSSTETAALQLV